MKTHRAKSLSAIKEEFSAKKTIVEMDDVDIERLKNYELLSEFFKDTFLVVNFQVNSNNGIWNDKAVIEAIYKKAKTVNDTILNRFLGIKDTNTTEDNQEK